MDFPVARSRHAALAVVATLIGALVLTACGDSRAPPPTQVAVRVNASEISVHQVNYALQGVPGGAASASDALTRQVVDRLVSQQLAVDRALELKLDLAPEVQQALQEARRNVLSRAYFDRVASGSTQPEAAEVSAFYDQRPELFAQRRIYTIQEIDIEVPDAQRDGLKKRLAEMPMSSFADYLRGSGLQHRSRLVNEPAENLSMDLVGRLAALKEGQSIHMTRPGGLKVLLLVSAQPAPISLSEATPAIKRYLLNDKSRKLVESDLQAMRTAAKLEYVGRFGPIMAASAPASAAAATTQPADAAVPAEEPGKAPATK